MLMRYLGGVCLLLSLAAVNCTKDTIASSDPEVFQGELSVHRADQVYDRTDDIVLIIDGKQYRIVHQTRTTDLCDSYGTQGGFGSNVLTLTPSGTEGSGCDNIRVPQGQFPAVFRGDSLFLGPTTLQFTVIIDERPVTEIWEYSFRLKQ